MHKDPTPPIEIKNEHNFHENLQVDIYYPDHTERATSNLFARTKHQLIDVQDLPCYICGSKVDREVHHYHIEWAFSDAADWNQMKLIHPDFDWTTFKTAEDFVDSPYNMMILCQLHHRGKNAGIHYLPYPIWIAQLILRKDFIFTTKQSVDDTNPPSDLNQ